MIVRHVLKSEKNVPLDKLKEKLKLWRTPTPDKRIGKENFIRLASVHNKYLIAILRYYVRLTEREITLTEEGEEITREKEVISQKWARLYFLQSHSQMYVLIRFQPETSGNRSIRELVRLLVSRCVGGDDNYFSYAQFNIETIHNDHSEDTWAGAITDRDNNVRSGILYGSNIAGDSDFGPGYVRSPKNFIGVHTDYFGGRESVKYNRHSFQLYKQHEDDEIIEWFRNEAARYII